MRTPHQQITAASRGFSPFAPGSPSKMIVAVCAAICALAVPAAARADVLPDGRVYEQVSPVEKHGNDAGASGGLYPQYSWATADGNALLYGTHGPLGTVHRGIQAYAVGRRGANGWSSESALPAGSTDRIFSLSYSPYSLVPSDDLTKILFTAQGSYVPDNPVTVSGSSGLYEGHADGTVDWLSRPLIADPLPAPGGIPSRSWFEPVGGSPDLSTAYFWSGPTLLAQDAARTPFFDPSNSDGQAWGLYEYSGGVLESAETLPDGTEPAGGAAPASAAHTSRFADDFNTPETFRNQVSQDGSTLWFVSPDPGRVPATGPLTQLYVRRGGHSTLVSHTQAGGPAPSGVSPVGALNQAQRDGFPHEYAFGSADGNMAIFQSVDVLAAGAPNDGSLKAYRYDVATDTVSYLPGVGGTVVAASDDGRRFLFGDSTHVAVWDEGTIKTIVLGDAAVVGLSPARATASGSVFLFSTSLGIPGLNSGGYSQIYRYDTAQDRATCVSCLPDGVGPSGQATLSNADTTATGYVPSGELVANRGMSDDGDRVFFDTPAALVARDANGKRDVYEWTPSGVSLISSGRSQQDSFYLDNSADGNDVFFATSEGLDPDDLDESYDVYDARVGGGFRRADVAAPCVGDACQGGYTPTAVSTLPASSTFEGFGNLSLSGVPGAASPGKVKLASRKSAGAALVLGVSVPGAGRVTVSGAGIAAVKHTYAKAGKYKLTVRLTAATKRELHRKRRLKVSGRVGFVPASGAASSVKFVLTAKA